MKFAALLVSMFLAFVVWAGSSVSQAGDSRDLSSVNGSVTASSGETYGSLSTVNGNVKVGNGVTADIAKTVNCQNDVGSNSKLGEARTVNGSLEIADDVSITRNATTVNGDVELGRRSRVGGDVTTVNGEIEIDGGEVAGRLITSNGDIELSNGARVRGGIHVKKKSGTNWGWKKDEPPKVHICSTCIVDGELRFDRPVELRVDQGGKIGPVIGENVTRL
jgi:DUF4097 and DUF4098 domain-containing protein YvlB